MDHSAFYVGVGIIVLMIVITVWDVIATVFPGRLRTISDVIRTWAERWPIVPFLVGVIAGHLFTRG